MEYLTRENGPMTTLGGVEGLGFIPTIYANDTEYPDIQLHMAPASISSDDGIKVRKILGVQDSIYDKVFRPIANKDAWTIMPLLLRPRSRGIIRLRSRDPMAYPYIDANYFDHPLDIATLVEGVKLAVKVSSSTRNNITTRCRTIEKRTNTYCYHLSFCSDRPGQSFPAVPLATPPDAHTRVRAIRVRLRPILGVFHPSLQHDHLSSGGHVQDGTGHRPFRRGGPETARVRRAGFTGGRRVDNADDCQR